MRAKLEVDNYLQCFDNDQLKTFHASHEKYLDDKPSLSLYFRSCNSLGRFDCNAKANTDRWLEQAAIVMLYTT